MNEPKPTRESLSKTPSWIMLGFVIGSIVALTAKRHWDAAEAAKLADEAKMAAAAVQNAPEPKEPEPAPDAYPSLRKIEAVFEQWDAHAVWRHEVTEVAFWNEVTNEYSDFIEVLRNGEDYYYRSIPALTRPIIQELSDPKVPLRFTEPESVREQRRSGALPRTP